MIYGSLGSQGLVRRHLRIPHHPCILPLTITREVFSSVSSENGSMSTFGMSMKNAMPLSRRRFWRFILEVSSWSHGYWSSMGRNDQYGTQGDSVLQRSLKSMSVLRLSWVGTLGLTNGD